MPSFIKQSSRSLDQDVMLVLTAVGHTFSMLVCSAHCVLQDSELNVVGYAICDTSNTDRSVLFQIS